MKLNPERAACRGDATALFERDTRNVTLILAGQTLLNHASNAFEELRRGVEMISSNKAHLLRVHCAPS
jgi:LysR family transcriptional regulator, glycine cleavage system transcriptional activator